MKAAIVQNLANSMFPRVAPLRECGVDARLFVGYTLKDKQGRPLPDPGQDPFFLTGECLDWVSYLDFGSLTRPFFYNLNELSAFDIVHSCCMAPIANQFFLGGKRFIALANGSDLRSYCLGRGLKPALLRRAYRRAALVLYVNLDKGTVSALEKLKIRHKARFLEYLIDFPEGPAGGSPPEPREAFELFYPSGLRNRVKGTSVFLEAFARLVRERPDCRLSLIDHGADRETVRRKVEDIGLGNYVRWHEYAAPARLAGLYRNCDVVVGYFRYGELGVPHYPQVLLEGCYFGKPVVSSYDRAVVSEHYEDFPVLYAGSPREVFERLVALHDDRDYCAGAGRTAREWFSRNCQQEKVTRDLLEIYREVL
ncbi:MAG: glycosyltransferase family 4 protein [Candidatus Glassbacteria bacterium]|nr:glycosyltransferase family 4 protein [Candidatus Glassbacteria bacterium]